MAGYSKEILGRGRKDWPGRSWFPRTIALLVLGFALGYVLWYSLGPRVLAHPQIGALLAGILAAAIVPALTLAVSIVKAPGKLLRERDDELGRLGSLQAELASNYWIAFTDTKIELFYGEDSRKTRQQRADALRILYEQQRDGLLKGKRGSPYCASLPSVTRSNRAARLRRVWECSG